MVNKSIQDSCHSDSILWFSGFDQSLVCNNNSAYYLFSYLFIWILLPFKIYVTPKMIKLHWTLIRIVKLTITFFQLVLFAVKFCILFDGNFTDCRILLCIYQILTCILIGVLLNCDRHRGVQFSLYMLCHWALMTSTGTLTALFCFQNYNNINNIDGIQFVIYYALTVFQLILAALKDKRKQQKTFNENACPYESASVWSRITFSWFTPLMQIGYRKQLKGEEVWRANAAVETPQTMAASTKIITVQLKTKGRIKLIGVIWSCHWPRLLISILLYLLSDACMYLNPIILRNLYKRINEGETISVCWMHVAGLFLFGTTASVLTWQAELQVKTIVCCIKSVFTSLVYRQCLKMSNFLQQKSPSGELINLMAVDVNRVAECFNFFTFVSIYPLQIFILFLMLYDVIGIAALSGLVVMIMVKICALFLAKIQETMEERQLKCKDERMLNINEIISGIKILKCFAWEKAFMDKIDQLRKKEISALKNCLLIRGVGRLVWGFGPKLMNVIVFATYILMDKNNVLNVEKIFITLAIIGLIQAPMQYLPVAVNLCVQANVSINRLDQFFNNGNLSEENVVQEKGNELDAISVRDAKFMWSSAESSKFEINVKNLRISKGQLIAVVGSVGSGKSSLLSAILGEMEKITGCVHVNGRIAYVSQQAWIQNATVKDNIMFGNIWNEKKYKSAIRCCDLEPDLALMTGNDEAWIEENGMNLSGGQKQRISLARAVYDDADIYLFDDPLSAVDPQVGAHIFNEVIGSQGILKCKTRVLVAHSLTHLPSMNHIIVLNNGEITESGSYTDISESNGIFAQFLKSYRLEDYHIESPDLKYSKQNNENNNGNEVGNIQDVEFTANEHMERGLVKMSVYLNYLSKFGYALSLVAFLLIITALALSSATQIYLSQWNSQDIQFNNVLNYAHEINCHHLKIYFTLIICQCSFFSLFLLVVIRGATNACIRFHKSLLLNVMRAPMSFFSATPSGRIVNRFSKDMNTVDGEVPVNLQEGLYCALDIFQAMLIICINLPIFILVAIPTFVISFFFQRFCIQTMDQLRRFESVTCSPLYSLFSETISGSSTIRAFKKQRQLIKKFEDLIDENMKYNYALKVLLLWSAIRTELIKNIFVAATVGLSIYYKDYLGTGTVALIINCSFQNLGIITLMWYIGKVESDSVSVERINDYLHLPTESCWENNEVALDPNWPQNGRISFEKYSTTYRSNLPTILKQITFTINPGEKIGLIGRTGAGKSSIAMAMFRMMEATEGQVLIDQVPIASLGLHDLRSRLTIIPQDPVLFSGQLRFNLDPYNHYSDEQVWKALELAHLKHFVTSSLAGLHQEIAEGGSNLSVGQKQLLCLARALLKKTKILILDEATAAVDSLTDALIQSTIRNEFSDCTIITIAHRLNTIMDCDRVIVLHEGQVSAFDKLENRLDIIISALNCE